MNAYSNQKTKMQSMIKNQVKNLLGIFGIQLSRAHDNISLGYIDAESTISAASNSGLSVGDYLETVWKVQGNRQLIIDELNRFGIFNNSVKKICEIGTGAGLYTEKTVELCQASRYESYETNKDWAKWLAKKYNLVSHDADGMSLSFTKTSSIDLVLAHGVFVYLPFLIVYKYFQEIIRVASNESYVVFDILSEDCFDDETANIWLESNQFFPCVLPKKYVTDFFGKHQYSLIGEFFNHKFSVGKSKYLIFKKDLF